MRIDALKVVRAVLRSRNLKVSERFESELTNLIERFDERYIENLKSGGASKAVAAFEVINSLPDEQRLAVLGLLDYYTRIEADMVRFASALKNMAGQRGPLCLPAPAECSQ